MIDIIFLPASIISMYGAWKVADMEPREALKLFLLSDIIWAITILAFPAKFDVWLLVMHVFYAINAIRGLRK